jgi:hypothetical protein
LRLGRWAFGRVVPGQRSKAIVARIVILLCHFLQTTPQMNLEPSVAARVAWRIDRFLAMLKKPLCVCESSGLFRGASGGKQKNFRRDRFGRKLPAFNFG